MERFLLNFIAVFITAIFISIFSIDAKGQSVNYIKSLTGPADYRTLNLSKTSDGGTIITGAVHVAGKNMNFFMIKLDKLGEKVWEQQGKDNGANILFSIKETPAGDFVACGHKRQSEGDTPDIYVVKADRTGRILWERTYGGVGFDCSKSIEVTPDECYMIAGSVSSEAGKSDLFLMKLNQSGHLLWEKNYDFSSDDEAFSISSTSDGDYILTGRMFNQQSRKYEMLLVKVFASGNVLKSFSYSVNGIEGGTDVIETNDGGFLVSGTKNKENLLVKINREGKVSWTVSTGRSSSTPFVKQTNDGGFITASSGGKITKINTGGRIIWRKKLHDLGEEGYFTALDITSEGFYRFSGIIQNSNRKETAVIMEMRDVPVMAEKREELKQ